MLDSHEANDRQLDAGQQVERRDDAGDRQTDDRTRANRPATDREVPLPGAMAAEDGTALAINQWLDGDVTEADARRSDSKQVEFWHQIAAETERRKRMVTPAYVAANIMAALPEKRLEAQTATATATATATSTRTVVSADTERGLSMNMAVAIGAGLFTVGLAIGKLVL